LGGALSGVSLTTQVSGTLPVANGGTGLTSISDGYILYGSSTSPINANSNLRFDGEKFSVNTLDVSRREILSNALYNTAVGVNALMGTPPGGDGPDAYTACVAVGYNALAVNQTSFNTAVGYAALTNNTSGASNTAVGSTALNANSASSGNTAIGDGSLSRSTGASNTGVGSSSLANNTTGNYNVAVGSLAMNGGFSPAITGDSNVAIGFGALRLITSGSNNIAFGNAFSIAPVFSVTNQSNRIVMGNTSITNAYVQVAWTVVSDARDKMNFGSVPHGLDFVRQLNPISYQFKNERDAEVPVPHGNVRYGFKAQDILALEGDQPIIIDAEDPEKLRYNGEALVPVLVNAIKELSAQVEQMKVELAALKG
jgi:hypothetical protein